MTDKKPREPYNKQDVIEFEKRYRTLPSGAVQDLQTGRFVGNVGVDGKYPITKDNARAMAARRREKAIVSQLRGLASKEGIALPPDATDDEILQGALDGIEALTAHMKAQFLKSTNIRGMAEAYSKLTAPLLGNLAEEDDEPHFLYSEARRIFHEIAIAARKAREQAINGDAEIIDATAE